MFWTAAAWIINAGLAAGLLLGAVLLSHAIIVASDLAVWVIATIIPTANLLALSWRWSKNPRKQNFLTIVLWANRVGVALAVLFGVASAVELTYSGLEKWRQLLVPPTVTAIAISRRSTPERTFLTGPLASAAGSIRNQRPRYVLLRGYSMCRRHQRE